jgi:DNA-binding NarL/FixJ family response regulator
VSPIDISISRSGQRESVGSPGRQPGAGAARDQIQVMIVDDHAVFAELLALAVGGQPELACCAVAHDVASARLLYRQTRPDVVVMDLHLGADARQGLELTRELVVRDPRARIIVLTAHRHPQWAAVAYEIGACGFLQKDGELRAVLATIRDVHQGLLPPAYGRTAKPSATTAPRQRPPAPHSVPVTPMTPREQEVLDLLGGGIRAASIARLLDLSIWTVRRHIRHISDKLGAKSQVDAVVRAARSGLIDMAPPSRHGSAGLDSG